MEPDSRRVINVLQAGRALAAIAVAVAHTAVAARQFAPSSVELGLYGLHAGQLGVDFFFVLSGFIIYHSTVDKGRGPGDYAWARIRRVYLPYLPVGIVIAVAFSLLPNVSLASEQWPWDWLATLTLAPVGAPALTVAWTLQHEVFFYVMFGLLYFSGLLWPGLAIWTAAILIFPDKSIPLALVNLEFIMGICAAVLYRRGLGHWLLLPGAAAIAVMWAMTQDIHRHSPLAGIAFACAILQLSLLEQRGRFTVPAWLIFLGNASYAIYLVHNPVISIVYRLVPANWLVMLAAGIAAAVVAGTSYYWFFERPLLRMARAVPWAGRPGRKGLADRPEADRA